jgi:hypothetical protein
MTSSSGRPRQPSSADCRSPRVCFSQLYFLTQNLSRNLSEYSNLLSPSRIRFAQADPVNIQPLYSYLEGEY